MRAAEVAVAKAVLFCKAPTTSPSGGRGRRQRGLCHRAHKRLKLMMMATPIMLPRSCSGLVHTGHLYLSHTPLSERARFRHERLDSNVPKKS